MFTQFSTRSLPTFPVLQKEKKKAGGFGAAGRVTNPKSFTGLDLGMLTMEKRRVRRKQFRERERAVSLRMPDWMNDIHFKEQREP